jgi:hypothetical protein
MDPRSRLLKNAGSSERYDSVGDEAEMEFAPRTSQYYEEVEDEDEDDDEDEEIEEGETIISPSRPFHGPCNEQERSSRDNSLNNREDRKSSSSAAENEAGMPIHSHHYDLLHGHGYRMVDRDGDFHQSRGKISIRKKIRRKDWRSLYGYDVFHSLVNAPTLRTIGILLGGYFVIIIVFSIFYYLISRIYGCNMGIESYEEAFLFSLESMATVGYGTQDIFFDDCIFPMVVLTAQMMVRIVCDAGVIGVIYARLARPTTRASTILFSNNAVIRRVRGKLYFMFQLCELRKHQLVEAHVRLYVFRQDRYLEEEDTANGTTLQYGLPNNSEAGENTNATARGDRNKKAKVHFQTTSLRLNHPNDDLGSMLLMCLPQVVVHEIDASSSLMPPPRWQETLPLMENEAPIEHRWAPRAYQYAETEMHKDGDGRISYEPAVLNNLGFPSVNQKNPYNFVNSRELLLSGMEQMRHGERVHSRALNSYADYFNDPPPRSDFYEAKSKSKVAVDKETHTRKEKEGSGAGAGGAGRKRKQNGVYDDETESQQEERRMIQTYMRDRRMEVVAIVEGMDAATGGVVQARHSFVCDDIKWNRTFVPCVHEDEEEGVAVIDFSVFHKLRQVPSDSAFAGVIASYV